MWWQKNLPVPSEGFHLQAFCKSEKEEGMKRRKFLMMWVHAFGTTFTHHVKSPQVCDTVEPSCRALTFSPLAGLESRPYSFLSAIKIHFSSILGGTAKISVIRMQLTIGWLLWATFTAAWYCLFLFIWEAVMRLMTHLKMRVTQSQENTVHLHWANINEPPVWTPRQHNSLPASPLCSSDKDITIARYYDL